MSDTATAFVPDEPEFDVVEDARPHQEQFKPLGMVDGIEVFQLASPIDGDGSWSSPNYRAGLYFWDDFEWCRLDVGFEASQRRNRIIANRKEAATLAAQHPGSGNDFTDRADAVFKFLNRETAHG